MWHVERDEPGRCAVHVLPVPDARIEVLTHEAESSEVCGGEVQMLDVILAPEVGVCAGVHGVPVNHLPCVLIIHKSFCTRTHIAIVICVASGAVEQFSSVAEFAEVHTESHAALRR